MLFEIRKFQFHLKKLRCNYLRLRLRPFWSRWLFSVGIVCHLKLKHFFNLHQSCRNCFINHRFNELSKAIRDAPGWFWKTAFTSKLHSGKVNVRISLVNQCIYTPLKQYFFWWPFDPDKMRLSTFSSWKEFFFQEQVLDFPSQQKM